MNGTRGCTIEGCQKPALARGWCSAHWTRWKRYGDPELTATSRPVFDRFMSKVDKSAGCWTWTAAKNPKGYGQFSVGHSMRRAHRVAWELFRGPIPAEKQIDHICHNRACVNPDHLRVTNGFENQQNRAAAKRNNASGIRGVAWYEPMQKYRARVGTKHLGYFATAHEAEAAAIAERLRIYTHNTIDRMRS